MLSSVKQRKKIKKEREISNKRKLFKALVYERANGKVIYYRDYQKVLSGEKTLEEVMGSGLLQSKILMLILKFLFSFLNLEKYEILSNEVGFQYKKSWRNLDIAIFEKSQLQKEGLHNRYVKTPPLVVIEVDTKADLTKHYEGNFDLYAREKTEDLLSAGVKKVVWFTTKDKKVMVAEKGEKWYITGWDEDILLVDKVVLNLKSLLEKEGISYPEN